MGWKKGNKDGTISEIGTLHIPQRHWVYGRGKSEVELFLIPDNRDAYRKMCSTHITASDSDE